MTTGTYYYVVRFSNCNNSQEYANYVNVFSHTEPEDQNISIDDAKINSNDNLDSNLSIFPNPSTGQFTLFINENISGMIAVYNNLSKLIYHAMIYGRQSQIDLSSQPKGIYFVKVQSADKIYTQKVLIQ